MEDPSEGGDKEDEADEKAWFNKGDKEAAITVVS